ncbi:hypothetical protein [Aurantimonas coralicida]|uniref:hypothetical protein n=1 Tax=Aurantimonas coralicida TaxID=182270 RepID=UPI001E3FD5DA|nr:hypothetical protein [Aurantimonas coralicida]MCD1641985.1 hypothetical protein [Aurantimonas coralicida]
MAIAASRNWSIAAAVRGATASARVADAPVTGALSRFAVDEAAALLDDAPALDDEDVAPAVPAFADADWVSFDEVPLAGGAEAPEPLFASAGGGVCSLGWGWLLGGGVCRLPGETRSINPIGYAPGYKEPEPYACRAFHGFAEIVKVAITTT